jgi:hypothetical protein
LILDDGYDGMVFVDLDRRSAVRRVVEGQRAGDQPYRLTRTGDELAVGWDEIYAVPLDGSGSRKIADSLLMAPAAELGTVWLWDYENATVRQIDLRGRTVTGPLRIGPRDGMLIGIPGGVAYETTDGIAIWDAGSAEVTRTLGAGQSMILDARAGRLAWCDTRQRCEKITITSPSGRPRDVSVQARRGRPFGFKARLSPNGETLATTEGDRIVLIDTTRGTSRVVGRGMRLDVDLAWNPSGTLLFAVDRSFGADATHVGMYDMRSGVFSRGTLPFGGGTGAIAVERDEIGAFLRTARTSEKDCPGPQTQPSGRTGACAFRF